MQADDGYGLDVDGAMAKTLRLVGCDQVNRHRQKVSAPIIRALSQAK
jgi:hypothetical protein